MGTNASYGGSDSADWSTVRDLWNDLDGSDLAPPPTESSDTAPPGEVSLPSDFQPSAALEALGQALANALRPSAGTTSVSPSLASLLPQRRGGGGGGGGGGRVSGSSRDSTRPGGRTRRQVPQQAARGGAAIGAAVAYRDRDAAALGEYGTTLAALDAMTPRQRNNAILELVLGDAGHPDEAAVRATALEQIKVIAGPEGVGRSAAEAVRSFIGELVVRLGLVELRDQILAGTTTKSEAKRRETSLRQWVASKVHHLDLAKYGTVSSRECHKVAFRMASDALRLMGKKK